MTNELILEYFKLGCDKIVDFENDYLKHIGENDYLKHIGGEMVVYEEDAGVSFFLDDVNVENPDELIFEIYNFHTERISKVRFQLGDDGKSYKCELLGWHIDEGPVLGKSRKSEGWTLRSIVLQLEKCDYIEGESLHELKMNAAFIALKEMASREK